MEDAARPLPVRWDGAPVEWTEWNTEQVFLCPPPQPRPCPGCGLIRPRSMCRGIRKRPGHRLNRFGRAEYYRALFAYRCSACGRDEVHESGSTEWWVLDDTDYGPDGSWGGNQ